MCDARSIHTCLNVWYRRSYFCLFLPILPLLVMFCISYVVHTSIIRFSGFKFSCSFLLAMQSVNIFFNCCCYRAKLLIYFYLLLIYDNCMLWLIYSYGNLFLLRFGSLSHGNTFTYIFSNQPLFKKVDTQSPMFMKFRNGQSVTTLPFVIKKYSIWDSHEQTHWVEDQFPNQIWS